MKITPKTALEYLDNCAKKYTGTREDHVILQASLQVLTAEVAAAEKLRAEKQAMKEAEKLTPIEGGGGEPATGSESE